MNDTLWQWDVYYTTHELMKEGVTEAWRSRMEVLAPSWHESWLIATQMLLYRPMPIKPYITRTELVI